MWVVVINGSDDGRNRRVSRHIIVDCISNMEATRQNQRDSAGVMKSNGSIGSMHRNILLSCGCVDMSRNDCRRLIADNSCTRSVDDVFPELLIDFK